MPRFVLLFHQTPPDYERGPHWDLMLEMGDALRTWALPAPLALDKAIAAEMLPDHRRAYLDYEGPVGGGRGEVRRVDAGELAILHQSDNTLVARLTGKRLQGELRLQRDQSGQWTALLAADHPAA